MTLYRKTSSKTPKVRLGKNDSWTSQGSDRFNLANRAEYNDEMPHPTLIELFHFLAFLLSTKAQRVTEKQQVERTSLDLNRWDLERERKANDRGKDKEKGQKEG